MSIGTWELRWWFEKYPMPQTAIQRSMNDTPELSEELEVYFEELKQRNHPCFASCLSVHCEFRAGISYRAAQCRLLMKYVKPDLELQRILG